MSDNLQGTKNNYPNYDPLYTTVLKTGGLFRECLVVDMLSLSELTSEELDIVVREFTKSMDSLKNKIGIEKFDIITRSRYNAILKRALRV